VVTVALQATIALLIYLLLGNTDLHDDMVTRIATAVAPLSVLPLIFFWKLLAVPAELHKEQMSDQERERCVKVMYLANIYVNEVHTPDAKAINSGLINPPQDWVNNRLEQYGYNWRVTFCRAVQWNFMMFEPSSLPA
jgi:hypothetical protein